MGAMSTALVVGSGLIGMSFAERFLAAGWDVNVCDVNASLKDEVEGKGARFFTELVDATAGVDFVQEAGPEKVDFKQSLFRTLAENTGDDVILASSTSAILPSLIADGNPAAQRILVGHPFTPPHLMPVLEIVPGPETRADVMDRAHAIYTELGFEPTKLKKEIPGFVGNRIQKVIMWEAMYLVQQGIASPEDVDTIIRNSLGLRYAAVGPFEANRLGGGSAGISSIFAHIAGAWDKQLPAGQPDLEHLDELFAQVDAAYGADAETFAERSKVRDRKLRGFLDVIKDAREQQ